MTTTLPITLDPEGITVDVSDDREFVVIKGAALEHISGWGLSEVAYVVRNLLAHQGGLIDPMQCADFIYSSPIEMTRETAVKLAAALLDAHDERLRLLAQERWGAELRETEDGLLLVPLGPLAKAGMDTRLLRMLVGRGLIVGEHQYAERDWEDGEVLTESETWADFRVVECAYAAAQPPECG